MTAARGGISKRARQQDSYARHRDRAAERGARETRAGQDIGDIPPVVDPKRRKRCARSLRKFCETYFPHIFYLPWSPDHKRVITKAEKAVRFGGLFGVAMPRGYGKTSICEVAVIFGIVYGHRQFPFFVGAEQGKALESLEAIKIELETNDLLLEDFPEVIYPFRCLEGISNRCKGQRYHGERTHIRWTNDTIVAATIPGSVASGAVIRVAGITGSIRGQKYNPPGGARPIRPDLVMIDDGQTRESARSPAQVKQRLDIIQGDILKLAGPGRKIAGLMPCTVIEPDDVADQILDVKAHPDWQGERIAMLKSMPARMDLWEEYDRIRRLCLEDQGDISAATKFYRKNRREMDRGAKSTWTHYFEPDEISNIQHAMNWFFKAPSAFASECQNQPVPPEEIPSDALTAKDIAARLSGRVRGEVPTWASRLTACIDVQDKLLPWVVCAWADDFTGQVIDYGTWPDQGRAQWTKRDARRTLKRAFPRAGYEGALRAGLEALTAEILGRRWVRSDGAGMRVARCLIDANYHKSTDTVYEFCHVSEFSTVLRPAHGEYIGVKNKPWHEYEHREGEQLGHHWRIRRGEGRPVRHVMIDTNYWKNFVHSRLSMAVGDKGALTLFGKNADGHRLFALHLTAEYGAPKTAKGRTLIEWTPKSGNPDNDWLDCLVGCAAAASMDGAVLPGAGMARRRRKKRRIDLNELQRNRKAS